MANLFSKNKLEREASKISTDEILPFIEIVKTWHNDYRHGTLKTDKETSREQSYNRNFFVNILGYTEKPASPFTLEPKATTNKGQLPDAVLSYNNENISAVVELKGTAIQLDKPQQREGNMSPVQQAFKYKTQYRRCPFVIVSNFYEFRLYQDNQLDYEIWTLDDLVDPANDYENFKSWYVLLKSDNFIAKSGASKTESLLSEVRIDQEQIGKKFYAQYKEARLDLLRDIYARNGRSNAKINFYIEKTQKIIDRVVFVCFAEDRDLLPENILYKVIEAAKNSTFGGSLWNSLKGFFDAIDQGSVKLEIPDGYNGGLFKTDRDLNALEISDKALKSVAELGHYDFREQLSVTILGHIFEQSISDLEEIKNKVSEDQNLQNIATSRRKKDGIFYTPDYIVRYIVDNSLGAYLREHEEKFKQEFGLKDDITDKNYAKREKQTYAKYQELLQNIKVVDPACGSGAFLVYVFDYLLAENQRVGAILGNTLFSADSYVRDILRNNIYGVDLNEESVEITKLSLWLKTAQKGKKLTALDANIKCGNSLISDPAVAGKKAFDWQAQFAEIFAGGGFDVVVGNPPYVRQELLGDQKPFFKDTYKVYSNTTDLFAYFYEKGLSVLRPNGIMSYISNTFAKTTGAGVVLRKYLQDNSQFEQMLDFTGLKIFEGATTYPIILVLRPNFANHSFSYFKVAKSDLANLSGRFNSQRIRINQKDLNSESWTFESKDSRNLRNKITNHKTVYEIYGRTYRGILTGLNEAFIIDEQTKNQLVARDAKSEEVIKPFWEGKDITKWWSSDKKRFVIVFPQGSTKQEFGELDEPNAFARMSETYAPIFAHLSAFREKAEKRYDKGDYWWEFRACNYYPLFEQPKVTWANLQNSNKFCFDDTGKYINAPAVILPSDDLSLLAILNSRVVWFFLTGICVVRSGGYIEVKPQYFNQIPIPKYDDGDRKQLTDFSSQIIAAEREIARLSEAFANLLATEFGSVKLPSTWWYFDFVIFVSALKIKLSLTQKDDLLELWQKYQPRLAKSSDEISTLDQQIDRLVYKLYNLTDSEIAIIEERK